MCRRGADVVPTWCLRIARCRPRTARQASLGTVGVSSMPPWLRGRSLPHDRCMVDESPARSSGALGRFRSVFLNDCQKLRRLLCHECPITPGFDV